MIELELDKEEDGLSALELLSRRIPAASPAYLRQLLRRGKVRHNGLGLSEDAFLRAGDCLTLPESSRLKAFLDHRSGPSLKIIFESREILVVFKPAGLAVHCGVGHEQDNLTEQVRRLMKKRRAPFAIAPVHRLDVDTSGPVLFGKGRHSCSLLGKLFMAGQVEKVYLGLVAGKLEGSGMLSSPVPAKGKLKSAATAYRRIDGATGFTLLELRLESGRNHQIRRQLTEAGYPLAGDRRYSGPSVRGLNRLFLHCSRLSFTDPFAGKTIDLRSSLPGDLITVLDSLGISRSLPAESDQLSVR